MLFRVVIQNSIVYLWHKGFEKYVNNIKNIALHSLLLTKSSKYTRVKNILIKSIKSNFISFEILKSRIAYNEIIHKALVYASWNLVNENLYKQFKSTIYYNFYNKKFLLIRAQNVEHTKQNLTLDIFKTNI